MITCYKSPFDIKIYADCVELVLRDRKTCTHPIMVTVARHTAYLGKMGIDLGDLLIQYFEAWDVP